MNGVRLATQVMDALTNIVALSMFSKTHTPYEILKKSFLVIGRRESIEKLHNGTYEKSCRMKSRSTAKSQSSFSTTASAEKTN